MTNFGVSMGQRYRYFRLSMIILISSCIFNFLGAFLGGGELTVVGLMFLPIGLILNEYSTTDFREGIFVGMGSRNFKDKKWQVEINKTERDHIVKLLHIVKEVEPFNILYDQNSQEFLGSSLKTIYENDRRSGHGYYESPKYNINSVEREAINNLLDVWFKKELNKRKHDLFSKNITVFDNTEGKEDETSVRN